MENKEIDLTQTVIELFVDEVPMVLGKTSDVENIEIMKIADLISNTQKGTNYNLTDEEYEEAHKELQVLMKKHMYGGGDE